MSKDEKKKTKELIPEPCRNLCGIQAIAKKQGKNLDEATVAYTLGFEAGKDYEKTSSSSSESRQGVVRSPFTFFNNLLHHHQQQ